MLSTHYKYPGTSLPKSHRLEGGALERFLPPFCDGVFLDYGCGEGVMFKYIKEYYNHFPSLIIGIDPDRSRLARAQKLLLKEEGKGIFLNTTFDNPVFRKESLRDSLSCIICTQIFGHIPEYRFINTLSTFHFLLEPQGVLIMAVPFINNEFSFPKWGDGADFFCLINTLRNLQDPARKIILDEKDFSHFADYSTSNLLPTRRFFINVKAEVNYRCKRDKIVDSRFGKTIAKSGFSIKDAIVYKVKTEKGSGDLMLSLSTNKL